MLTLKYYTEESLHRISFKKLTPTLIQITGDFPIKAGGFQIYKDHLLLGDYRAYRTVYRTIDHGAQFSCDGRTYSAAPSAPAVDRENTVI